MILLLSRVMVLCGKEPLHLAVNVQFSQMPLHTQTQDFMLGLNMAAGAVVEDDRRDMFRKGHFGGETESTEGEGRSGEEN